MKKNVVALLGLLAGLSLGAQEFTVENGLEPVTLDPQASASADYTRIYEALFEGLCVPDPETCAALPGLAESWSFSPDFKTITFKLRGTSWSDGVPITADTVRSSWIREMDPMNAFPLGGILAESISGGLDFLSGQKDERAVGIRAVDSHTLVVELTRPTPFFPEMVCSTAFAIVPDHVIQKFGTEWASQAHIVSNGPFILKEWKVGEKIVLEKNQKYWDSAKTRLKRITFLATDDANVGYKLYTAGAADWTDSIPEDSRAEARQRPDFHENALYGTCFYIFNTKIQPLDDIKVRKALAMASDKGSLVRQAVFYGTAADALVPASHDYAPAEGIRFDPEGARKLLAEAGFPGGSGFPVLDILYNKSTPNRRVAEDIQTQWKANLGIETRLVSQEWSAYSYSRSQSRAFDVVKAGFTADYLDPSAFLDAWKAGNFQNYGGYSNAKYDDLLAKAASMSGTERLATLSQAENLLVDEDVALIPLYHYVVRNLIDTKKWAGWYPNPMDTHPWKFIRPMK